MEDFYHKLNERINCNDISIFFGMFSFYSKLYYSFVHTKIKAYGDPLNSNKTVIYLLLTISSLFTVYGSYIFYEAVSFKNNSLKTVGKVINVRTRTNKYNTVLYAPVIVFQTKDFKEVTFESYTYHRKIMNIGDGLSVMYEQQNPSNAKVDDFQSVWGGSFLFLTIGLIGILFSFLLKCSPQ